MKGLTPKRVFDMMTHEGKTQTEIALEYDVSRQYVHILATEAGYVSDTTKITENFPWEVDKKFYSSFIYRLVRLHGKAMLAGIDSVGVKSRKDVESLHERLKTYGVVIDYGEDYPPLPNLNKHGGFAFLPRTKEDEDFILKIRDGVKITDLGNKIWRLPKE